MQCLILAGGLGTRMREFDPTLPKTLLPVAGRPFADWQLDWLGSEGVDSVVYSIGYKAQLIREHVGTGQAWGLSVDYVEETEGLVGTGGAVRLAVESGRMDDRFFVLYGDSYLQIELQSVDAAFQQRGLPALMTVFENNGQWDASNVVFDGNLVSCYEKGAQPSPELRFIDYGLLEFDRQLVIDRIPPGRSDLADLLGPLSRESLVGGYEAVHRFFEIGTSQGLFELDALLADRGP